jgi:hypothetical protein
MASKDPQFLSFLSDLREARAYRGITLEAIAKETHIPLDSLKSLESGEWKNIDEPFLRGHLMDYALAIDMVEEKVMKRFDDLNFHYPAETESICENALHENPNQPEHAPILERQKKVPSLWEVLPAKYKLGLWTIAAFVLALVLYFFSGISKQETGAVITPADIESTLQDVIEQQDERRSQVENYAPFEVDLVLSRPAKLTAFISDSMLFAGTLRADSFLTFLLSSELTLHLERLEDLRLQVSGELQVLPDRKGQQVLRVNRLGIQSESQ